MLINSQSQGYDNDAEDDNSDSDYEYDNTEYDNKEYWIRQQRILNMTTLTLIVKTFKAHPRTLRHARGVKEVKDSAENVYNDQWLVESNSAPNKLQKSV